MKSDNYNIGPYLIHMACMNVGPYLWDKLDGTELGGVCAWHRLKKYFEQ